MSFWVVWASVSPSRGGLYSIGRRCYGVDSSEANIKT